MNSLLTWQKPKDLFSIVRREACENTKHKTGNEASAKKQHQ